MHGNTRRILVTGSTGQLGSELHRISVNSTGFEWFFADRSTLDFAEPANLAASLSRINPSIVFNCAAYTAVDKAESEYELADKINHQSVAILAKWCAENSAQLVHISTDYVFDGTSQTPLTEDAPTAPISVYGATKLAGEQAIQRENPDAIILRTAWVYSTFGNNFVKTILRLFQERDEIHVVNDQIGSPTYAADLAEAMLHIVSRANWQPGIYHYANQGQVSWYAFACAIQEITQIPCLIHGIPSSQYPTPAKRPNYSLLCTTKFQQTFQLPIPNYRTSLEKCLQRLAE
jgi:dTDP-4-dehydrorhamnose reductase